MIAIVPLMLLPLLAYNLIMLGVFGGMATFSANLLSLNMMSGADWTMSGGDLLIVASLVILFVEIMKATRTSTFSVVDHLLSMLVFVAFLIEFLMVKNAATQVFFILMTIAFIDVIAGFAVSIRSASRDVSIGL
ncbi:hypothetical protein [Rhizobium sp. L1K21]|uniref:hypothetical protein n=1 Tax=Rhizobium sp. L1K21 TaxID=2954933 RepID=UPI00209234CB|nr:hypothetical protein [Rhizobium sp. L1K21]MCO6188127.1 hypothetical protein [Rhizobium sp. L1K21]